MSNPVAHFELYGDNPEKLGEFYKGVFGWEIKDSGVPGQPYWLIRTVPVNEKSAPTQPGGINGGLMKPTLATGSATSRWTLSTRRWRRPRAWGRP